MHTRTRAIEWATVGYTHTKSLGSERAHKHSVLSGKRYTCLNHSRLRTDGHRGGIYLTYAQKLIELFELSPLTGIGSRNFIFHQPISQFFPWPCAQIKPQTGKNTA